MMAETKCSWCGKSVEQGATGPGGLCRDCSSDGQPGTGLGDVTGEQQNNGHYGMPDDY